MKLYQQIARLPDLHQKVMSASTSSVERDVTKTHIYWRMDVFTKHDHLAQWLITNTALILDCCAGFSG